MTLFISPVCYIYNIFLWIDCDSWLYCLPCSIFLLHVGRLIPWSLLWERIRNCVLLSNGHWGITLLEFLDKGFPLFPFLGISYLWCTLLRIIYGLSRCTKSWEWTGLGSDKLGFWVFLVIKQVDQLKLIHFTSKCQVIQPQFRQKKIVNQIKLFQLTYLYEVNPDPENQQIKLCK